MTRKFDQVPLISDGDEKDYFPRDSLHDPGEDVHDVFIREHMWRQQRCCRLVGLFVVILAVILTFSAAMYYFLILHSGDKNDPILLPTKPQPSPGEALGNSGKEEIFVEVTNNFFDSHEGSGTRGKGSSELEELDKSQAENPFFTDEDYEEAYYSEEEYSQSYSESMDETMEETVQTGHSKEALDDGKTESGSDMTDTVLDINKNNNLKENMVDQSNEVIEAGVLLEDYKNTDVITTDDRSNEERHPGIWPVDESNTDTITSEDQSNDETNQGIWPVDEINTDVITSDDQSQSEAIDQGIWPVEDKNSDVITSDDQSSESVHQGIWPEDEINTDVITSDDQSQSEAIDQGILPADNSNTDVITSDGQSSEAIDQGIWPDGSINTHVITSDDKEVFDDNNDQTEDGTTGESQEDENIQILELQPKDKVEDVDTSEEGKTAEHGSESGYLSPEGKVDGEKELSDNTGLPTSEDNDQKHRAESPADSWTDENFYESDFSEGDENKEESLWSKLFKDYDAEITDRTLYDTEDSSLYNSLFGEDSKQ